MSLDQAERVEPGGSRGDLVHAVGNSTAKLRLYAGTLADCLPALLACWSGQTGVCAPPPQYLALLPDLPDRLKSLADELDAAARDGGRCSTPSLAPAPPVAVAPGLAARPQPGARPRALLVEDDFDSRELTRIMLELDGFEVEAAADGAPALAALAEQPFDLVLMDCRLTGLNGWEATARLRKAGINRDVPVIGLSASPEAADRARALAVGMDDYVVKPLTEATLADLRSRFLS